MPLFFGFDAYLTLFWVHAFLTLQSVVSWDRTELAAAANSVQDLQAAAASKSGTYWRQPPVSLGLSGGRRQAVWDLQADQSEAREICDNQSHCPGIPGLTWC